MSTKPEILTPEASSPPAKATERLGSNEDVLDIDSSPPKPPRETSPTALNPDGAYDHLTLLQQLHIHWNKLRLQYWQEDQYEKSVAMAERMLREQDLPLFFRAQCYLTLSNFDITAAHASTYAATAVSILDDMKAAGAPVKHGVYKNARDVLAEADEVHGLFDDEGSQNETDADAATREQTPEVEAKIGVEFTPLREQLRPHTRSAKQQVEQQALGPSTPAMSPVRKEDAGEE